MLSEINFLNAGALIHESFSQSEEGLEFQPFRSHIVQFALELEYLCFFWQNPNTIHGKMQILFAKLLIFDAILLLEDLN